MFFKLLKYNLKSVLKSILPFIIFLLTAVIMMNITSYNYELGYIEIAGVKSQTVIDPPTMTAFWNGFAQFLIYISLILLVASTVRANWQRFSKSFYSDEAYLTHTLPVSQTTLYVSMFATILISLLIIIVILILSSLLLVLSGSGQRFLDSIGLLGGCVHCFNEYYSLAPHTFSFYLTYILVLFTELMFLTLCGITGIIFGHRSSKVFTLISGTIIYVIGNVLLIGIFLLLVQLDPEISYLFDKIPINTPSSLVLSCISRATFYISLIYITFSITLYFVNQKLLQRGINLD